MEISENGLNPCPFCGNSVVVWETGYGVVKVLECKTCDILFVFPWSKAETGKDLADLWNRRTMDRKDMKCLCSNAGYIKGHNSYLSDIKSQIMELAYPTEGIGCGLEDEEITDRYEAAAYGWNEAIERVLEIIANAEK